MATLTADLGAEDIENWFKIGVAASKAKPEAVAVSALGGRTFNSSTGQAKQVDLQSLADANRLKFKRSNYVPLRQNYVEEYKKQEREELLSQSQATPSFDGRGSPSSVIDPMDRLELDSTVIGSSVAMPEDLVPDGATEVYKHYKFEHNYMQLPVLSSREKILSTIESNQVTIIQGPTGSGKTTQIPQFILDYYAEESQYCNIIVTQPRKIAALSIAQRVCDERGWNLGSICGYQIGLERKCSEDTRLLYCTTGVLKEKFIHKKNMHEFTHVILDEVHERDIESDFAILIVKKLLRSNSRHVKIILMSATFDTKGFAEYFAIPVRDHLEPAPVVTIGTVSHHVSEFFADDLISRLGPVPPIEENRPGICPAMYEMAVGLVKEFDLLEEKELGKDPSTNFAHVRGSVLIFLPGLHEITTMCNKLKPLENTHFLIPVPLHSSITLFEQRKVFRKTAKGYRKIIVATNIAESSITVPDIKYVIDFCLTKNLCCDPETNYTHLQLEWASKVNTVQRKGRAGRVSNGRVYFMVPRYFYERCLPEYGIPEMQRSPLESLILKTKVFNMGEPKAILSLALSPPDLEDIERTILSLKEVGALSTVEADTNPHDGELTFIGRVLADLPVSVYVGKMILYGHVFGLLEECLIIGAAMSVKSIFASPLSSKLNAYKSKLDWSDNSMSDAVALLNAYKVWDNRTKTNEFKRSGASENDWGLSSYIQIKTIKEVAKLVEEMEQRLDKFNIRLPAQKPNFKKRHTNTTERLLLKMVLCAAFYPHYTIKEETDEEGAVKILSNNDPLRTVVVKSLPMNQGILYQQQIRDIFFQCCRDPPPVISCEESKAFVEFNWKPGVTSERRVHPGVYAAIKMRELRTPMFLDELTRDEAKKQLDKVQNVTESLQSTGNLRTHRLKGSDQARHHPLRQNAIHPTTSTLLVNITEVVDCGHFWAQCDDAQSSQMIQDIQTRLNRQGVNLQPLIGAVRPGMLVAAPFVEDEREWFYRALVESQEQNLRRMQDGRPQSVVKVKVFFVDYGNTEVVESSRLRCLPIPCTEIPFLAHEFYLKGIRPSSTSCPDGKWSNNANATFKRMALYQTMYAHVYSILDNVARVELIKIMADHQEISMNEYLVEEGCAEKTDEPFLSQQDHEWRESQQRGESTTKQPNSWLQVNLALDTADDKSKRENKGSRHGRKHQLTGPTNPLEMTFSSVTFSGRQRVVRVDPDSVNCVAIDENPQNKFSRLMVASHISMTSSGLAIMARDTTILPQIPSLPALVILLFAPYAEFRTDQKGEKYVGALCGLGFDCGGRSILPDHDIEVVFETKIDLEDIDMVNKLRMTINNALCTDNDAFCWGNDQLVRIQETVRKQMIELLKKPRESMTPQSNYQWYKWNMTQVDQTNMLETMNYDPAILLPLHMPVHLKEVTPSFDLRKLEYYMKHLQDLQAVVDSHMRKPVQCELCQVTAPTSQILALHMQTEKHLKNAISVQNGTFKSSSTK